MSNTKLKVAAEEIKDILRKHDIAGSICLHSPGHGEYFMHLNTSYSCAYIYNDGEVRIRSKREDYPTREEQHEKLKNTANMFKILMDQAAFQFMGFKQVSETIDKATEAEHF